MLDCVPQGEGRGRHSTAPEHPLQQGENCSSCQLEPWDTPRDTAKSCWSAGGAQGHPLPAELSQPKPPAVTICACQRLHQLLRCAGAPLLRQLPVPCAQSSDPRQGQHTPPWPPRPPCCCPSSCQAGLSQPQPVHAHSATGSETSDNTAHLQQAKVLCTSLCMVLDIGYVVGGLLGGINMGKQLNTDVTTPKIFCLVLQ